MSAQAAPTAAGIEELAAFEAGLRGLAGFSHREHVRIGFSFLARHPFAEAAHRFSSGLKRMAERGGRGGLYHETVTIAFLALIGERRARGGAGDFAEFERNHPDLFDKNALAPFYSAARLDTELARQTFLLPDPACR